MQLHSATDTFQSVTTMFKNTIIGKKCVRDENSIKHPSESPSFSSPFSPTESVLIFLSSCLILFLPSKFVFLLMAADQSCFLFPI